MKKAITLFFALIVAHCAWAYSFTVGGIYYNITSDSTVEVTYKQYLISSPEYIGNIAIPSTVTYLAVSYKVTAIGDVAFYGCTGLSSISIPASVTSIEGVSAFYGCIGLTSITIPSSINSIGDYAFKSCTGLTTVNYNATNCITMGSSGTPVFSGCTALKTLIIGSNVTNIPNIAFLGCTGLTSVIIPSSVTSIGSFAFQDCTGLTSIYVSSITPINLASSSYVFSGVKTATCTLHVPFGSINSYKASYPWSFFVNIVDDAPVLTTTSANNISSTSATAGGNITDSGAPTITARGVCWSTTANPTIANSKTTDGSGTGVFTSSITGLSSAQTYHIRAYATNSVATSYGSDLTFTTLGTAPTITTTTASNIATTTATAGGNVTNAGTSTVTARGVCWSTSSNPTIANSKTTDGIGVGAFTSSITGLITNTTYHIRAYATSSVGTSYGSDLTLTTNCLAPSSFNLSAPTNGGWTTSTPLFQWATSIGASTYNLYIDGVLKKANIAATNYQILSNEAIASGMHTWYVEASNGCVTQSNETWSFRVDATQPSAFNLVTPSDNSWSASLQPTLTWSAASDANSGLAIYQLWIDGTLNRDNIASTATSTTPTTVLTNGSHTWEIKAVDNVGNVRNSTQTLTVKIDNTPPGFDANNSLYFDGIDDYAETNNPINLGNIITVEAWVCPVSFSADHGIITWSEGSIRIRTDGLIEYFVWGGGGHINAIRQYSVSKIYANQWTHIAFVKNLNTGTVKFYINGVLDASITNCYGNASESSTITFGRAVNNNSWAYLKGYIDEIRVWNVELNQAQIQANMNSVINGNCSDNLVGNWKMNEKSGSLSLMDVSPNNLTANLFNGPIFYKSTNIIGSGLCDLKQPFCKQYIKTNTPTFSWGSAPDTGIGFQKFQLFIDGNIVKDNLTDSTCTVTTPLAYGQHTWYVKGFDLLGNNQPSYGRTFYIDNARPNAFNLLSPTNNQVVNLPTPNLTWQATTDSIAGSGIRKYQLLINGVVNRDSIPSTQTTVAPKNALTQGVYTWAVKAYDNVGNVRQSTQTNTFFVDWDVPTDFMLIEPLNNATITIARPSFKWQKSTDLGSGLQKYELCISGQSPIIVLPTDTTKLIGFDLPNGQYTWYVKAYDVAGGFTSSNSQTFTVNVDLSGVEQPKLDGSIKIYPNPVGNELIIESTKNEKTNFEILNSIGQVLYTGILFDKALVETSRFNSGIYIVKLEIGKKYEFKKILKK